MLIARSGEREGREAKGRGGQIGAKVKVETKKRGPGRESNPGPLAEGIIVFTVIESQSKYYTSKLPGPCERDAMLAASRIEYIYFETYLTISFARGASGLLHLRGTASCSVAMTQFLVGSLAVKAALLLMMTF